MSQKHLDKLAREFPHIHQKIVFGELNLNQAIVQTGIRKSVNSILSNPADAVAHISKHMTPEQIETLIAELKTKKTIED